MKRNLFLLFVLIVLTGVAWLLYETGMLDRTSTTTPLSDFAIEDTSSVDQIFIADQDGNTALLVRQEDQTWRVNDKYRATDYKVQNLLNGFKNIAVKAQVPTATKPGVISMIAGRGRKVEIYQNGQLSKTWLIGTCTPDHFGTYMVLETPEAGRSSEPFIMRMEGFSGCLRQRYFAWEKEWRHTGIFNYPTLDLARVELTHHESPDNSFDIRYGGGNDLELHAPLLQKQVPVFDTLAVKDYLLLYKKVHCETYTSYLEDNQEDSLRNAMPAFTIRVTDNKGGVKKVDLHWKKPDKVQMDPEGNVMAHDGDRMYAVLANGEVALVQRYTFDPLLGGIARFAPKP